jgi:uncharacterized protein YdaU (DUF1376 family)
MPVNYYPRYPGDYLIKTVGITMIEDGAYTRLLDWYYSNEKPIEHADRYDIARATTSAAKAAVDKVLGKFFERDGAEWRHQRADEEIAKAGPRIEAAKANGAKGGRKPSRYPNRNPSGNPPGSPVGNPAGNPAANPPAPPLVTQQASSPTPTPTPSPTPIASGGANPVAREHGDGNGTPYGLIARTLRNAGIEASPGEQRFRMLVDAGATSEEFLASVPKALTATGNRFAYLLGIVEGERKRARETATQLHRGPMPATESTSQREARQRVEAAVPSLAPRREAPPMEVVDVVAKRVG